eukprot:sb/3467009/
MVCDKDPFKGVFGAATLEHPSHPLATSQDQKLRLRGVKGGKLRTILSVSTSIEKSDKQTANKLMKKRAKSFSKKELRRTITRAKTSLANLRVRADSIRAESEPPNSEEPAGSSTGGDQVQNEQSPAAAAVPSVSASTGGEDPPKYRLTVQFYECANLSGKGSKNFFDTYVKLRVGEQEQKTKVVQKNANPKFNETFQFDLADLTESLKIRVFHEKGLFDDLLGGSKIRLSVLPFDTDLNINEFPLITDEASGITVSRSHQGGARGKQPCVQDPEAAENGQSWEKVLHSRRIYYVRCIETSKGPFCCGINRVEP